MVNTLFIGKVLLEFEELESTNAYLMALAGDPAFPEGTVVQANHQTQGRGQHGKSWSSAPGMNLMMSVLLAPKWMEVKRQWVLNACVAVAVAQWVSEILPHQEVKIKWPNDILVEGRKLAGMLLQNTLRGNQWQWCVAGIGLNVFQTGWEDPAIRATSLKLQGIEHRSMASLRDGLLQSLEQHYLRCKAGETFQEDYLSFLFLKDRVARFYERANQSFFDASPIGVSAEGQLILEAGDKRLQYAFQEIQWIPEENV